MVIIYPSLKYDLNLFCTDTQQYMINAIPYPTIRRTFYGVEIGIVALLKGVVIVSLIASAKLFAAILQYQYRANEIKTRKASSCHEGCR